MDDYKKTKDMNLSQPISRRNFLGKSLLTLAGASILGVSNVSCKDNTTGSNGGSGTNDNLLRVIAYNVYSCTGWPRDHTMAQRATRKNQMPTRIAQELALYDPDIITFSESPDESIVKEIAKHLDMDYVRFPSAGYWPGTLLTRYEIVNSENVPVVGGNRPEDLFTRHWGKATIKLPNSESIIVHSVHLYPHDNSEARDIRKREISEINKAVQKDINDNRSILLQGDLNHTPEMPGYKQWIEAGWTDTFSEVGEGEGLTINADDPERRIDYVLTHGPISKEVTESQTRSLWSLFEGAFRTNPSDPNSFALSDHLPQLAIFETGDFN